MWGEISPGQVVKPLQYGTSPIWDLDLVDALPNALDKFERAAKGAKEEPESSDRLSLADDQPVKTGSAVS